MRNYKQRGDVIGVTAPAAVQSGDVIAVGNGMVGVAAHAAESGNHLELAVSGVYVVPAGSGGVGDVAFWDGTQATDADGGGSNTRMGHFTSAVSGGVAEVRLSA